MTNRNEWFKRIGGTDYPLYLFFSCRVGNGDHCIIKSFEGLWSLDLDRQGEPKPLVNGRPHYVHSILDAEFLETLAEVVPFDWDRLAHLCFIMDLNYKVPRWKISPHDVEDENGWAFCESAAQSVECIDNPWITWTGFEWTSEESGKFVPIEDELQEGVPRELQVWIRYQAV